MNTKQTLDALLSPTEAARLMGMTLNQFKHHLKNPAAPQPVLIGRFGHRFYREDELLAWTPRRKRKP